MRSPSVADNAARAGNSVIRPGTVNCVVKRGALQLYLVDGKLMSAGVNGKSVFIRPADKAARLDAADGADPAVTGAGAAVVFDV